MRTHMPAYVCVDTSVYIYTQVTRVCQDIPHHMSGTFNKHSSFAILDEHPQYPLETALTVTLIWQLNNNPPNSYKFTTYTVGILDLHNMHTFISKIFQLCNYLRYK